MKWDLSKTFMGSALKSYCKWLCWITACWTCQILRDPAGSSRYIHTHTNLCTIIWLVLFLLDWKHQPPKNKHKSRSCVEGRAESSDASDVWTFVVNVQANPYITRTGKEMERMMLFINNKSIGSVGNLGFWTLGVLADRAIRNHRPSSMNQVCTRASAHPKPSEIKAARIDGVPLN